jgi:DNA-binding SARP family transcriptional activator
VEFRVLGLLEVVENGRPVAIGSGKERALLALLLVNANRPLSVDSLIDELWDERRRPENAAKTVQIYVSRLRGRLGGERILTTPAGYVLRLEAAELDTTRFEQLAAEGQTQLEAANSGRAEVVLSEALALWRGEALADFRYDRFAQAEIARLEERHGSVVADRVDARLALGQAEELIAELEALVREQPLWERPRRQLMLALYRTGRQADALDAYQSARAALVEELGIEPSRSLREIHQQILNQDPALDVEPQSGPRPGEEARPPAVSRRTTEPATRDARKTVTAVFFGISLSSDLDERLDPETLRRLAGAALGESQAAAERHGGSLETVSGDAITAVFGLPTVHEDDALRAVRAAVEAREALAGLAEELAAERAVRLDFRIGISTGEVIAGGEPSTQGRATGEPLTHSSRLALSNKLVIDQATHRLIRGSIIADAADDVWHVVDVVDGPARHPSRLASPMVGRERERRRLRDAFEQAVGDRSCQLFTVLGLAGVGKSRLVEEFVGGLAGGALVARGRCLPYGEGITYWPLAEAVKEAVGLRDSESPEEALARLARALEQREGAELAAQRVAETIGLVEAVGGVDERFAAVEELFVTLARRRPLVVVFDDIHWGEATFLDLVEHLAGWVRGAPILLVCLARPELLDVRPGWGGGKPNATATLLEPLSGDECAVLIRNLVGQAGLDEEVETRIAGAAEGNPLFVEEMLSMLIDDGLLVGEDGRWKVNGDVSTVRVPPTIQALLAARLDQLDVIERAVIERAAVGGKVFYEGAVADLAPATLLDAVPGALVSLTRKDLIRPEGSSFGEQTYHFRHLLIRDAAYDSIPKEARAELHERFGRWLDRTAAGRAIEHEEVVGYHLEQAYRYRTELGPDDCA